MKCDVSLLPLIFSPYGYKKMILICVTMSSWSRLLLADQVRAFEAFFPWMNKAFVKRRLNQSEIYDKTHLLGQHHCHCLTKADRWFGLVQLLRLKFRKYSRHQGCESITGSVSEPKSFLLILLIASTILFSLVVWFRLQKTWRWCKGAHISQGKTETEATYNTSKASVSPQSCS